MGVLRIFIAFVFFIVSCVPFINVIFIFFLRKSTSWVKYIECGLTPVGLSPVIGRYKCFYIVQLEAHFNFQFYI